MSKHKSKHKEAHDRRKPGKKGKHKDEAKQARKGRRKKKDASNLQAGPVDLRKSGSGRNGTKDRSEGLKPHPHHDLSDGKHHPEHVSMEGSRDDGAMVMLTRMDREAARRGHRNLVIILLAFVGLYALLLFVRHGRAYPDGSPPDMLTRHPVLADEGLFIDLPPYTEVAFDRSRSAGADILYLPVRMSSDGVPVVAMDDDLQPSTGVQRRISSSRYADLRQLNVAHNFYLPTGKSHGVFLPGQDPAGYPYRNNPLRILRLDDVLRRYPDMFFQLDIRQPEEALAAAVMVKLLSPARQRTTIIGSPYDHVIQRARELSAGRFITVNTILERNIFQVCYLFKVPCPIDYDVLQISSDLRLGYIDPGSEAFIAFAHRHGLAVQFSGVTDPSEMVRLWRNGADGLLTENVKGAIRTRQQVAEEERLFNWNAADRHPVHEP
ncbi:MAG: hypothetical protein KDK30_11100 [Leptospiraceae bacterium]|nr:hypothetical protein [Leptospiraceae bacterium]